MNKSRFYTVCTSIVLLTGVLSTATAQDAKPAGAQLFLTKVCASCHGPDGRTPIMPMYPKVAGQNAGYLYNQLRDIKSSSRNNSQSVVMKGITALVTDKELRTIANWLATQ